MPLETKEPVENLEAKETSDALQTEVAETAESLQSKTKAAEDEILEEEPTQKKVKYDSNRPTEVQVGITQYLGNKLTVFTCEVKSRYKDFLVNEIDLEGNVLHLEEEKIVDSEKSTKNQSDQKSQEAVEKENVIVEKPKISKLNDHFYTGLSELLQSFQIGSISLDSEMEALKLRIEGEDKEGYVVDLEIDEKGQRTSVHEYVRQHSFGHVETKATEDKKIHFTFKKIAVKKNRSKAESQNIAKYCHFNLYKENQDTMQLFGYFARVLRVPAKNFQSAGTKDKRGVTVQRVSALNLCDKRLRGLNRKLNGSAMSSFSMEMDQLQLGQLSGNEFTVVLRDIQLHGSDASKDLDQIQSLVESELKAFEGNGLRFLNYFGLQRFGTSNSTSSHLLGQLLLEGKFVEFVNLLLQPQTSDLPKVITAKQRFSETRDYKQLAQSLPNQFVALKSICTAFSDGLAESNCLAAILRIPRTLRMMYLHAYQSFIFNQVLSKRIQRDSTCPIVGDLIKEPNGAIRLLTEADDLTQFTLEQVVLPLPGAGVEYPTYSDAELKDIYTTLMQEHSLDPNDMHRRTKELSLAGDYRNIVHKAETFSWYFLKYTDPIQDLTLTDLDLINKVPPIKSKLDGDKLSVVIKFQLKASTYATMLIREITKKTDEV